MMETVGWIVVGFQLTGHHYAAGLIEGLEERKRMKLTWLSSTPMIGCESTVVIWWLTCLKGKLVSLSIIGCFP